MKAKTVGMISVIFLMSFGLIKVINEEKLISPTDTIKSKKIKNVDHCKQSSIENLNQVRWQKKQGLCKTL